MKTNISQLLKVMEDKTNILLGKQLYNIKHKLSQHGERLKWLFE